MKKVIKNSIVFLLCAACIAVAFYGWRGRQEVAFADCLDETIFTANGQEIKIKQLGFYVLYEEREIELQAQVYNPKNTRDYWNLHIDGVFVQTKAKDAILNMAIHDELFYQKALEENLKLNAKEEKSYRNAVTDFWMDLLDEQVENMPVSDEYVIETMHRIALAEKYQRKLAKDTGKSVSSYNWDGPAYEKWLQEQNVKMNKKLWERIVVGNISLQHGSPNYINGHGKKESE